MLCAARLDCIRRVLVAVGLALVLAGCGDSVKQARDSADLRGQIQAMLQAMEMQRTIPGLQHRHVALEPDAESGGFAVKIYDVKLGAAAIGFQSFNLVTFILTSDGGHFTAQKFKFSPKPVSDAPETPVGALIAQLQRWATTIQLSQ